MLEAREKKAGNVFFLLLLNVLFFIWWYRRVNKLPSKHREEANKIIVLRSVITTFRKWDNSTLISHKSTKENQVIRQLSEDMI